MILATTKKYKGCPTSVFLTLGLFKVFVRGKFVFFSYFSGTDTDFLFGHIFSEANTHFYLFPEMTGTQHLFPYIFKVLLRRWDLSHRVERQKLMVTSREEMSVRVRKGGFMASLLAHYSFRPNVLFQAWQ